MNGIDSRIPLEKFPTKLSLANQQYTLRGIVHFIEPPRRRSSDINLIGHYVAICLHKTGQWVKYNDLKAESSKRKSAKFVSNPHLIMYTI